MDEGEDYPQFTVEEVERYCASFLYDALVAKLNYQRSRHIDLDTAHGLSTEEYAELARQRRWRGRMRELDAEVRKNTPEVVAWLREALWGLYKHHKSMGLAEVAGVDRSLSWPPGELARLAIDVMERQRRERMAAGLDPATGQARRGRLPDVYRGPDAGPYGKRPKIAAPVVPRPEVSDFGKREDGGYNLWKISMLLPPFEEGGRAGVNYHGGCLGTRVVRDRDSEVARQFMRDLVAANRGAWHNGAVIKIQPAIYSKDFMPGAVGATYSHLAGGLPT